MTNNVGDNPGNDLWKVEMSNDGGINWLSLEETNQTLYTILLNITRFTTKFRYNFQ